MDLQRWLTPMPPLVLQQLQNFFGPDVAGHSIHSGGATALAQLGIPLDLIQALG